jgi:phosphoribosylformylglycinamidine synthase
MVGLIEAEAHITTQWFKKTGDVILLVGSGGMGFRPMSHRQDADAARSATLDLLGGSRFLKVCFGVKQGPVPSLDLDHEIAVQNAVRELIKQNLARSAHDCSEGGLAVAIAECCFNPQGPLGAKINITDVGELEACANLFSETQSRIIISVASENLERAMQFLHEHKVPHQQLGTVGDSELTIDVGEQKFRWPIADLYDDWWNSIKRAVEQDESIPSL